MHAEPHDETGVAVIRLTATFPGVVAVVVGLTYVCGIAVRAGQLRKVGLTPWQNLTIYSPADFLVQGITIATGIVLIFLVVVGGSFTAARWLLGRPYSVVRPPLTGAPTSGCSPRGRPFEQRSTDHGSRYAVGRADSCSQVEGRGSCYTLGWI